MHPRSILAMVAAATLAASATAALADEPASDFTLTPKYLADAPDRRPAMDLLDKAGMAKSLDDLGISIYGFAEASYTYNLTAPSGRNDRFNDLRVFDIYKNKGVFDQADLTIERTVDPSKGKFDVGFHVEMLWGSDASLVHSNGLFNWYDSPQDPQNQFDLNQAYVDFAIPVGNGLLVRAGKFVTLLGAETINPTNNPLFSHSYLFGFAIPFTHTGVMTFYQLNDEWLIGAGITRGWEQSNDDNNSAVDFLGHLKYTSKDKKWTAITCLITGPEQADNNGNYRTVFDEVLIYTPNPDGPWTFTVNGDYGWEESVPGIGNAQWYGVAGYAGYKLNNMFTLNGRVEWFRDDDGSRVGLSDNLYEATVGVTIHPFPNDKYGKNLMLRPEIRYDWSDHNVFNNGNDSNQATLGLDVIFTF